MELIELKKECEEKRVVAERLYKKKSANVFLRELRKFSADHKDEITKKNGAYYFKDKIEMSIMDGNLEIIDKRGTLYLWLFELETDYTYSDIFEKERKLYSVHSIRDVSMADDIKKVMLSLDYTISELSRKEITCYKFLCDSENVAVDTFEKVIRTVLDREPIIIDRC